MPMQHWFNGGHMVWMMLWWLVGIAIVVAFIWVLVRLVSRGQSDQSPETILRRRYATGEIDTEEFERRLAALGKTRDAA